MEQALGQKAGSQPTLQAGSRSAPASCHRPACSSPPSFSFLMSPACTPSSYSSWRRRGAIDWPPRRPCQAASAAGSRRSRPTCSTPHTSCTVAESSYPPAAPPAVAGRRPPPPPHTPAAPRAPRPPEPCLLVQTRGQGEMRAVGGASARRNKDLLRVLRLFQCRGPVRRLPKRCDCTGVVEELAGAGLRPEVQERHCRWVRCSTSRLCCRPDCCMPRFPCISTVLLG